jgi:cytoskeletal protein CcmA (bactofilin family)
MYTAINTTSETVRHAAGAKGVVAAIFIASAILANVTLRPAVAQSPNIKGSAATAQSPPATSGNKYAAGGQVRTPHAIDGDFFAAGGRVVIDQPVKGDATLAGGSVNVNAPVGDDVRAAGGDVNINSTIGGELVASAGNITLGGDARIAGATSLFAGNVTINGKVMGPLNVRAQTIVLNGEVGGDARLAAAHIKLGPTAKIGGALSYTSSADLEKADGALIAGTTVREENSGAQRNGKSERVRPDDMQNGGPSWQAWIFIFLTLLGCSVVFLLMFPTFSMKAADIAKGSPWSSLGLGLGALVGLPILATLLVMTVLGIPIAMLVMALYPALMLLGFVVGVASVARFIVIRMRKNAPESSLMTIAYFALALLLTLVIAQIPFVGFWIVITLALIGMGACVRTVHRRRQVAPAPLTA